MTLLRSLAGLMTVLLLLLLVATIFVITFDANHYKGQLIELVKQQTGRELSIDGDIALSVYPDIALTVQQVKLGNAAGFNASRFAAADSARVVVQLLPLLEQKLRVDEVLLERLTLNLQRNRMGATNWADLLPTNSSSQDDPIGQIITRLLGSFVVAGISVKDSRIHWQDELNQQELTLAPLNLTTGTLRPGKPVDIQLTTRLQQTNPTLDMTLEGNTTAELTANQDDFTLSAFNLALQAKDKPAIGDTLKASLSGQVHGRLSAKTLQVKQLQAAIDAAALQADLQGNLQGDTANGRYTIADLQAQVQLPQQGTAHISGQLQTNLAQNQLSLQGMQLKTTLDNPKVGQVDAQVQADLQYDLKRHIADLATMQLQATAQGGQLPMQKADIQASGQTHIQVDAQQVQVANLQLSSHLQGGSIPQGDLQQQGTGKLDLNWGSGKGVLDLTQTSLKLMGQTLQGNLQIRDPMAELSANGNFKADSLSYPPFQLQQATLGVQMVQGLVTLTPKGTLFKGGYEGMIKLNTHQSPATIQMTHKTSNLRTEDLFFALTQDKTVTGALNLTANLNSIAGDINAFKQHLDGNIQLDLKNGTIRDANFAQKTKQVVKLFEREKVNELGEKEVAFTTLSGQWQVKQGVFQTDDNTLVAPYFQIKGNGDVDLVKEALNFKLRVSEIPKPDKPEGLFAPLHIHGPWQHLSYALELDVLLKELAKRELEDQKADLKAKLEAEKDKQLQALREQRDAAKDQLKQQVQQERDKIRDRLEAELHKQLSSSDNQDAQDKPAAANSEQGKREDQLKQQLEQQLKNQLKGLF